ncbi:hypothetical protein [Lactococcus cremoris]|uniref:Uncharacterized protein n=1 Tax=Lactococcus cremoris subsp. tructae TaxID=542833 RepID=A0A2A5SMQ5_LACLC|nr:hypothetical protein [Lactococcus cremoris]PCS14798.1 hypothetical protein RU92_GL002104 [Lactococcus cremoris subsp. tructae]
MKNGIYQVSEETLKKQLKRIVNEKVIRINASKIYDYKTLISSIGAAFGMNKKQVGENYVLPGFTDNFGDFLYYETTEKQKNYILVLENWSNIQNEIPQLSKIKILKRKENYLKELQYVIEFLSEFDPTDPDEELIDFTVFVVD